MADLKTVFVAFAIEDKTQRDVLKGQSLHPRAPYEFIDMSVKNSLTSSGQKWEIQCAKEEGKRIRGIWAYKDDRTTIDGVTTYSWSDDNIAGFIDSL
jgi:hypothetical protein